MGNGQVPVTKGGIILGGRQRTVTLSRDDDARLAVLAKMAGTTPVALLEYIVSLGVERGWQEMMVGKTMWLLANWGAWATWK